MDRYAQEKQTLNFLGARASKIHAGNELSTMRSALRTLTPNSYNRGVLELASRDLLLKRVLVRWGNPPFWTHDPGFPGIVLSILAQQVSLESAEAAFTKLMQTIPSFSPEDFLSLDDDQLRTIGFSRQKASYVRGIAHGMIEQTVDLQSLNSMDDDGVRDYLTRLRGIGPWTADVYLLFCLRRADAWPTGDLALIKAIQELNGSSTPPEVEIIDSIADQWRPWRAVAARMLWYHYLCSRGRIVPS
jgi:DNA-3-methyladenine glycosylase II